MKTYLYIIQGIKRLFQIQLPEGVYNDFFESLNEASDQEITPLTDRDYLLCLV